jgi:hypothetical protein
MNTLAYHMNSMRLQMEIKHYIIDPSNFYPTLVRFDSDHHIRTSVTTPERTSPGAPHPVIHSHLGPPLLSVLILLMPVLFWVV